MIGKECSVKSISHMHFVSLSEPEREPRIPEGKSNHQKVVSSTGRYVIVDKTMHPASSDIAISQKMHVTTTSKLLDGHKEFQVAW